MANYGVTCRHRAREFVLRLLAPGEPVRAFQAARWGWGGGWSGALDYQHFSANGR